MPATRSVGWPDARPGNPSPVELVRDWYDEAVAAGLPEPEAMALATASPDGVPSVRIVLLKGIDDRGAQFFTNYESRKGRELDANPRAAATLYWQPLLRSVRLEGAVERLGAEESDAYFATRDRGSRLGAWASRQGTVIESRAVLEAALAEADAAYPGDDVPRPGYWGGYRLVPDAIELWEGRPNRLHERVHFLRELDGSWRSEHLSP
ncbi:MAG: pyridoxamine 5'-phosphate oxidase [Solirubrobacteraceae bacterium]